MSASNSTSSIAVRRGLANCVLDRQQFAAQHLDQPRARAQDVEIAGDLGDQFPQLVGDLLAFEAGQALQPQIEDRARLLVGKLVGAVRGERAAGLADQLDQRPDIAGRPAPSDETGARVRRVGRGADQRDDLVDIGDRDQEADQDVRPLARLVQQVGRAPGDDLLAERDKGDDDVAQGHLLRAARRSAPAC